MEIKFPPWYCLADHASHLYVQSDSMTMFVLLGHDSNLDLSSRMMIMKMRKVKVTKIRTVLANTGYCKLVVNKHKVVETPGWSNSANIYVHRP